MKRSVLLSLVVIALINPAFPAQAQDSVFPLPAPLYILTSNHVLLRVNPVTGEQTPVSPPEQPIIDFDISPDGAWYVYRTTSNSAVIVSEIDTGSGFVLEFDVTPPQQSSARQTVAWSPGASAIAYIVPGGLRIAELGAGEYGGALFSDMQGPWIELYWAEPGVVIASDEMGTTTRISGTYQNWSLEAVSGVPLRPQPVIPSYLIADGVTFDGQTVIPRTAGALAFEWGPLPPPVVEGLPMPADLYFLTPDAQGNAQVWQLPQTGAPAHRITAESAPVVSYAVARNQIAAIVANTLVVMDLNGSDRRLIASPQSGDRGASVAWSPDGAWLAYHDARGVWVVPAAGDQPPRLLQPHQLPQTQAEALNVKVFFSPRWSPDGSRLLVTIGLWEGSLLGVIDVATGSLTELTGGIATEGLWTDDGRVLTWAAYWGYVTPGLFLLDPAAPDALPSNVMEAGTPVVEMVRRPGGWVTLVASTAEIGPQFLRAFEAGSLAGPFVPVEGQTGGFMEQPAMIAPGPEQGGSILVAGLRNMSYDGQGNASGDLAILDLTDGEIVQIRTSGLVWDIQWGQ